jgi:hypothetical protein
MINCLEPYKIKPAASSATVQGKEPPVDLQPGDMLFIVGHYLRHFFPESEGVILNPGMDEFMDHYIVDDFQRGQDQPPGEAEVPSGCA